MSTTPKSNHPHQSQSMNLYDHHIEACLQGNPNE